MLDHDNKLALSSMPSAVARCQLHFQHLKTVNEGLAVRAMTIRHRIGVGSLKDSDYPPSFTVNIDPSVDHLSVWASVSVSTGSLRRMFKVIIALSAIAVLVARAPANAQGFNPAASSKASTMPVDPGVSPEAIDMLADAVIAKLKAKPEILLDIVLSYEEKMRAGQAMIRPEDPSSGPADADVTIVEFFDPSCISCRTVGAALASVAMNDPKLRVVHKDYPVTSEGIGISIDALGGKSYSEARKAIMAGRAPASADAAGRARALEILAHNREAAKRAQVNMLPTLFVVGPHKVERIEGQVTAEDLAARISAVRGLRK